jgi:hypothetical protein
MIAQAMRAILLATATATSLAGFLASSINFDVEHKNIFLVELRDFEFPHRLDPSRHIAPLHECGR